MTMRATKLFTVSTRMGSVTYARPACVTKTTLTADKFVNYITVFLMAGGVGIIGSVIMNSISTSLLCTKIR